MTFIAPINGEWNNDKMKCEVERTLVPNDTSETPGSKAKQSTNGKKTFFLVIIVIKGLNLVVRIF